jgi:uncharacterized protein (TIGR02466 family)
MGSTADRLPLLALKVPDYEVLNAGLRQSLADMSNNIPGKISNLANGSSYFENKWLSASNLHESDNPDVQKLRAFIEVTTNRSFRKPDPGTLLAVTSMWGMVSRTGMSGNRHNHAGLVSGAYYVDAGSSGVKDGGLMQFYQQVDLTQPTHRFQPESGQVFLFPSSLEHSVSLYEGKQPRMVIAFNLTVVPDLSNR